MKVKHTRFMNKNFINFIIFIRHDSHQNNNRIKKQEQPRRGLCKSRQICRRHPLSTQLFIANAQQEIFDRENLSQDHGASHSQCSHSMTHT